MAVQEAIGGNSMRNPDTDGFLRLVAEVLSLGAQPGHVRVFTRLVPYADYFRSPCGRWWAEVADLDPAVLWRMAVKDTAAADRPYALLSRCPFCRSTDEDLSAFTQRHG